jgi:antirestriction protein ArdC
LTEEVAMVSSVLSRERFDVHRTITEKVVDAIERGAGDFVMPWHRSGHDVGRPTNAWTGQKYRGVNVVALWAEAVSCGYRSAQWASFRQWQKLGATVRKGEHGTVIVFYKSLEGEMEADELERRGRRLAARASRVFCANQVVGWQAPEARAVPVVERLTEVGAVIEGTKASIIEVGDRAYYDPVADEVRLPDRERFVGSPTSTATESFYATLLHELTHWSGAAHRLNRTFGSRFGDNEYAFEELVAELGAAFLCSDLGIANDPRPDHAAYLAHWLTVLKSDRRALFSAARLATTAAEYITGLSVPF